MTKIGRMACEIEDKTLQKGYSVKLTLIDCLRLSSKILFEWLAIEQKETAGNIVIESF